MMSRTIRYFKLMYIVAGILMSNEKIIETVDQIQISPRVEVKESLPSKRRSMQRIGNGGARNSGHTYALSSRDVEPEPPVSWLGRFSVFYLMCRVKHYWRPLRRAFSIWTIPNYLLHCSTSFISRRFLISSDCDMIYNK